MIDPDFKGVFKLWALNDEYVVLANSTLNRKWKPGWAATYQWGLNTPPAPTVAAGTSLNKTIDDFESLTGWSFTGGGGTGNLQADAVHNYSTGAQSMRLTLDAQSTIIASKTVSLDLSKFVTSGDIGATPYLLLPYYTDDLAAIQSIVVKFSCAVDGGFTTDYYRINLTLGGYVYTTLSPSGGVSGEGSGAYESSTGDLVSENPNYYSQQQNVDNTPVYTLQPDGTWVAVAEPQVQVITKEIIIQPKSRDIVSGSGTWTEVKIPLANFARIGSAAGRDWSTITKVAIEVQASSVAADISFDDWQMIGGGNLFGNYWAAVAYQNAQGNYGPFTDFVGPVALDAQSLLISGLTPDADGQTTKRRILLLGGSLTQPMITYLEDNTSTTYELNELETSLINVESYFNNRPPPEGIVDILEAGGRMFVVKGNNQLIYSEPGLYEAFPLKNYRTLAGGENLYQLGLIADGYVAARGRGQEYITYISNATPAFWSTVLGAEQGAVSSRMLLKDPAGPQVFMSEQGFYASGGGVRGEYLEKINPIISAHSTVFGDMIFDRAYIWFTDTSGVDRVLRIDYRLNRPVAHYVANLTLSTIFADKILGKVYYAIGGSIYEFDGGSTKLGTTLTIPGQLCGSAKLKTFESLNYELEGGSLGLSLVLDRVAQSGSYTLAAATRDETPASLPQMVGMHLSLVLTSTAGDDFTLYLPWILDQMAVS